MHVCEYETFDLGVTLKGTHFIDLTERIDGMIARAGVREGTVHVISRHTTTAVTINEMEDRLVDDARMFFHELAPGKILFTQRPRSTTRTAGLARRGRGVARARARELSLPPVEHAHRKQREHSRERREDDAGHVAELHVRRVGRSASSHRGHSGRRHQVNDVITHSIASSSRRRRRHRRHHRRRRRARRSRDARSSFSRGESSRARRAPHPPREGRVSRHRASSIITDRARRPRPLVRSTARPLVRSSARPLVRSTAKPFEI